MVKDGTTVSLSPDTNADLVEVRIKLPATIFAGRVRARGPRRSNDAVIRWLLDTHPVAAEILKGTGNDAGNN